VDWNTWLPPLMAAGVGLAAGLTFVWKAAGDDGPDEQAHALRAHKAALMERLRELELERPKLGPETYEAERRALVTQAAETLRRIEELEARGHARPSSLLVPVSVVVAIALGTVGVMAWPDTSADALAVPLDQAPTSPASGGMGGMGAAPSSMAEVTAGAAASLPDSLDELNAMAYDAMLQGQLPVAMGAVEKARQIAPDDPLVNTHLNIMRLNVGMVDKAAAALEAIVAAHPEQPRPLLWLAYARGNQGDDAAARVMLEAVLDLAPDSDEATLARQWMMEIDQAQAQ
jgi:predicted Zn-dependent protease